MDDPRIDYIIINKNIFDKLKQEAVEAGRSENAGILTGTYYDDHIVVSNIERFNPDTMQLASEADSRALWKKIIGAGVGGTFLDNPKVIVEVKSRNNVVGLYHTHPTRDRISPGDKREIIGMKNISDLSKISALHIICRKGGIIPWGSKSLLKPAAPLAYVRTGNSIKNVDVRVI